MDCCCSRYADTLHYSSPAHGGWGVVRIGMLVPESYQLFVCPFACGRHGAIGALTQGLKDRLSYLYVDQSDIIDGYDALILEYVPRLLSSLRKQPRVLFIFVSCLDDLIGTDHEALLERLREEHPGIDFEFCHMNPITMDTNSPPPVTIQRKMYGLLKTSIAQEERLPVVNCIGNLDPVAADSELYEVLANAGMSLAHISVCEDYDAFQLMARSRLNLVVAPPGVYASREMERCLGIPYLFSPVSYRLDEIGHQYEAIAKSIPQIAISNMETYKTPALEAIERTLRVIGDLSVVIDASAVCRPFGLARALLEYGFNVRRIMAQKCIPSDQEDERWILERYPRMEVLQPLHHDMVKGDKRLEESLSVGVEGAYFSGSRYPVDMANDEGMFGYGGVVRLMNRIRDAVERPVELQSLINTYGLVV